MHSQALLGQGGGHLVGQRGELRGVGHVDAAGGGHGAELVRRIFQRDDLGAVVSARLGRLTEAQFVALNLRETEEEVTWQQEDDRLQGAIWWTSKYLHKNYPEHLIIKQIIVPKSESQIPRNKTQRS